MRIGSTRGGLAAAATAAAFALGLGGAQAAPLPVGPERLGLDAAATPVAMCGVSCRRGRYIPGPPSVCAMHGLNYCGPSRRAPVVVVPPRVYGPSRVYVDPRPRPRPRPRCFVDSFGRTICR